MSLVVRNVTWWDPANGRLHTGDLLVATDVAPLAGPVPAGATVIDGRGGVALPGLVCAHHHLYSALARGMPAPPRAPRNFAEILELVWWRLDRALDRDMVLASALAGAIDLVRCGVTAVVDHHASPRAWPGSLAALAEGLDTVGLAHVLCTELSDRDGPEATAAALAETDGWLAAGRPGLVGLHASFTVGDALLDDAVALARRHGTGLHLHVAEDPVDQERCLAEHGCRVVERLQRAGALALPGTILGHCLHVDERERALITAAGAWVAVNTESNQNNGVGASPPRAWTPQGCCWAPTACTATCCAACRRPFWPAARAAGWRRSRPGRRWATIAATWRPTIRRPRARTTWSCWTTDRRLRSTTAICWATPCTDSTRARCAP